MTNLQTFKNRLANLQSLNERFAIAHHIEFLAGRGGLPVANIKNDLAEATIALQGGHVMTFRPRDHHPVLWLSAFAPLNENKPIRGGIPVCWPWFGPHATDKDKPAHGYARNVLWDVIETQVKNGATQILLSPVDNETTRNLWSPALQLQLVVTIGTVLQVDLITRNTGDQAIILGEALHTYFNVSDVTQVSIHGLENCQYIDKVDNSQRKVQEGPVTISRETDRVYLNTTADCVIEDPGFKQRIRIAKQASQSTVIWNPWAEKAAQLGDLGYQGYLRMLCVETANALENEITVAPGEEHRLQAVISVESF